MATEPLVVPLILVTGSLHFVEVNPDARAQEVIQRALQIDGLKEEVLGELEDAGWALQNIRVEHSGRAWEEDELTNLGDGLVQSSTSIAPIVNAPHLKSESVIRHFSSFPMTAHLHHPVLRLVSLHRLLVASVVFARVPEVQDDFEYKVFVSRTTAVSNVIETIMEELGLAKSIPIPGAGNLEYVLEEVWVDGDSQKATRLPASAVVHELLKYRFTPNPFGPGAKRIYRFCVPEEWYRRTKSRNVSTESVDPSEETLKKLASLQESDESEDSEEDDGTAKIANSPKPQSVDTSSDVAKMEERGLVTSRRLSSMFDGWLYSSPTTPEKRGSGVSISTEKRKSVVSEPVLLEESLSSNKHEAGQSGASDVDKEFSAQFEAMLDELGLKEERRVAMRALPLERRKYLLRQNQEFRSSSSQAGPSRHGHQPSYSASYSPATAAALIPRLVPQLTGDASFIRRFSITGWGSSSDAEPPSSPPPTSSESRNTTPRSSTYQQSTVSAEPEPIQPQTTGGLWTSWWASSGGDNAATSDKLKKKEVDNSARSYITSIQNCKVPDMKLVKHLISLRVHLSTAKLAFIEDFVVTEQGLQTLGSLLATMVGKSGKRKRLTEMETTVLLELIKCFRVLLNTEIGFSQVLASPTVVTHISYSLHTMSLKVHTLAAELLAAICILSMTEGHKVILAALSDFRVAYEENFRFETLISTLRLPEIDMEADSDNETGFGNEEEGVWEARTASMALINALTTCPESLEERIMLREEFTRRGLNEIIVTLRYIKPPDTLQTQLDVYTEEKFEDEEDMRERVRGSVSQIGSGAKGHERSRSDSDAVMQDLIQLAKEHGDLYPTMLEILKHYGQILQRDVGIQLKADLFTILDRFVEQAARLETFDDNWNEFLKRFASSVQHITGQELDVRAVGDDSSRQVVEEELTTLRNQVEELSEERSVLRAELNQRVAEVNTLKSLPSSPSSNGKSGGKGGNENFHGLVQRLVQKEKQVLQLQTELDRFRAQNPGEGREADERAKRERDKVKWNTLMEEIAKLKHKIVELEGSVSRKDKDISYLKRALESVYTRFQSREEARDESKAEVDPEVIANRAIERLTDRERQITALSDEITDLKAQLAAKPKTEQEFKTKSAPPPPPPSARKPRTQTTLPPPPPPPPPPPAPIHTLTMPIDSLDSRDRKSVV